MTTSYIYMDTKREKNAFCWPRTKTCSHSMLMFMLVCEVRREENHHSCNYEEQNKRQWQASWERDLHAVHGFACLCMRWLHMLGRRLYSNRFNRKRYWQHCYRFKYGLLKLVTVFFGDIYSKIFVFWPSFLIFRNLFKSFFKLNVEREYILKKEYVLRI